MNDTEILVKRCMSGLRYWDVICNGVLITRCDRKWEAEAIANELREKLA